ncbi:unnamed protein product [Durusdinium trenchii]|uniref:Uncharacterized protein n=2 Tax=Durusdinium trenchii TaxID=1381693 RepID=A0ABP0QII5_9DINO
MDPYSNPIAVVEDPYIRGLSYALVHGMYIKLLLWPVFLCYDYSMDAVPLVESLQDARLLLPCAAYLGFVLCGCHTLQRLTVRGAHSAKGAVLGLAIFVLSFLPMTNLLFPIGTLVAERLLYLPSIGFLVVLVCFAYDWARGPVRWLAFLLAGMLLAWWWWLCHARVGDWRTVEQITLVDGLKQLRSSRTQFNLANLYLQSQRMDEALAAYRRAVAADPQERDSQPLYHAGQILMYKGHYQEAETLLHKAVTGYFSPLTLHEEEVWHDYALALWHVGKHMEAAENFQNAIITNPSFPKGHNNLACALVLLGLSSQPVNMPLVQQGLQAAEHAITLAPLVPLYWRNAAVLLSLAGDLAAAQGAWERFRQMDAPTAAREEVQGIPRDCTWEFYFR